MLTISSRRRDAAVPFAIPSRMRSRTRSSVFLIAQHAHLDPPQGDETPGYRVWHPIDAEY
jgi:hypothetical protein